MSDERTFDPRTDVDITGLEWWEVLQRLHRATRPVGPFARSSSALTDEAAMELIGRYIAQKLRERFNYIEGRPMKIGFHTRHGQSWVSRIDLYNRDSPTPAKVTIDALRAEKGRRWRTLQND